MMRPVRLIAWAGVLIVLAPLIAKAEMKQELKIDGSNLSVLQTMFGTYGYRPERSVLQEKDGLRLALPANTGGVTQTGVYSYFALSGDCEVTLTYELIYLQPPIQGYGSGVGLAFDAGDEVGRGILQRVVKTAEGNGYVFQSGLAVKGGPMQEEYRFTPTTTRRGKLGLRRVKKELIFLTADAPTAPLEEVERLPFTDRTIRAVRFFADPGGSPTAINVRVREIEVRAEEIAGGVPEKEQAGSKWWWLWVGIPAAVGGALVWRYFSRRRMAE